MARPERTAADARAWDNAHVWQAPALGIAGIAGIAALLLLVLRLLQVLAWERPAPLSPWLLIGAVATVGLAAIPSDFDPPSPSWVFGGALFVALLAATGLADPLRRSSTGRDLARFAWPVTCASAAALFGGMWLGGSWLDEKSGWALVAVVAGALLAAGLPVALIASRKMVKDVLGTVVACGYAAVAIVIGTWMLDTDPSKDQGLAALNVVEGAFDVMVFALFRDRFSRLFDEEAKRLAPEQEMTIEDYSSGSTSDRDLSGTTLAAEEGAATIVSLFSLGGAVLLAMVIALAAGATPLGLDDSVRGQEPDLVNLTLAAGVLIAVSALAMRADRVSLPSTDEGQRQFPVAVPHRGRGPALEVTRSAVLLLVAAATALCLMPVIQTLGPLDTGERHFGGLAAVLALLYGALTAEALWASAVRVQLVRLGRRGLLLVAATSAAVGAASWWLLTTGLWSDGGPVSFLRAAGISAAVLLGCVFLAVIVCRVLAHSGTGEVFTPQSPVNNALIDHGQYALLLVIAGIVPFAAIAHLEVTEDPVTVIGSLLFIPGLIGGFLWVLDNNRFHHAIEQALDHPKKQMWQRARREDGAIDAYQAYQWLEQYQGAMEHHRQWQNGMAKVMLATGMTGLAAFALAA